MICPYLYWLLRPLQPVAPLLQGQFYGQELPVADVVVAFSGGQTTGEEGAWVHLLIQSRALRQHSSNTSVGSIYFDNELFGGVWMNENGGLGKPVLKVTES